MPLPFNDRDNKDAVGVVSPGLTLGQCILEREALEYVDLQNRMCLGLLAYWGGPIGSMILGYRKALQEMVEGVGKRAVRECHCWRAAIRL